MIRPAGNRILQRQPGALMSISFQCDGCGKTFSVADELAGKAARCKQCGRRLTIPGRRSAPGPAATGSAPRPADPYGLAEPDLPRKAPAAEAEVLPTRAGMGNGAKSSSGRSGSKTSFRSGAGGIAVMILVVA